MKAINKQGIWSLKAAVDGTIISVSQSIPLLLLCAEQTQIFCDFAVVVTKEKAWQVTLESHLIQSVASVSLCTCSCMTQP